MALESFAPGGGGAKFGAMLVPSPTIRLLSLAAAMSVMGALGITAFGGNTEVRVVSQCVVLGVVLFAFSKMVISSVRLPRAIVGAACLAALTGAVVRYGDVGLVPGSLLVARFENDRLGSQTTIVRDKLRSVVGSGALVKVGTLETVLESSAEAQEVLGTHPKILGVVWGSERWLNVSLRVPEPLALSSFPSGALGARYLEVHKINDLKIITGVPMFGLSKSMDYDTSLFIGRLIDPLNGYVTALRAPSESLQFEREVRAVAGIKSTWTSFAHRAVPMWMTGTYHLTRALFSSEGENGDLACALTSFRAAKAQLRPGDNPALEAAILNNEAVLRLIRADMGLDEKEQRTIALEAIIGAARLQAQPNAFPEEAKVWGAVRYNLEVIRAAQKRKRVEDQTDE